jgi:hypothetical protein
MSCAINPNLNAHQMRKQSARLSIGAYREKGNRAKCAFTLSPKAHQSRTRSRSTEIRMPLPPGAFKLFEVGVGDRLGSFTRVAASYEVNAMWRK